MAKMYYNQAEACERLSVSADELLEMVRSGKLHAYADGAQKMFKVAEVDELAPPAAGESDIQLAPVDLSGTREAISPGETGLESADSRAGSRSGSSKGDTVITSEGISIFDDEDLEIEPADPMAKTQIAPSLGDQIAMEGAPGGSGLLDLTRESDDTSLGEVLDTIDMETGEVAAPSMESVAESIEDVAAAPEPTVVEAAPEGELDAATGALSGMAAAGAVLALLLAGVAMAVLTGKIPAYVHTLGENLLYVLIGAVAVVIVGAVAGMMVGKKAAEAQQTSDG